MSASIVNAPGTFVAALVGISALTIALTSLLLWHGLRRALDVPRVPRPRAMYGTLAVLWAALAACASTAVIGGLLLRDHKRLAGPIDLAFVRCEPTNIGRLRMEVLPIGAREDVAPEHYDVEGGACAASIVEVDLRPALRVLGIPALARLDAVGPHARPRANPAWLTPGAGAPANLTALVVRQSRLVQVVVPPDTTRRFVLTASPGQDASLRELPARQPDHMAEAAQNM